MNLAEIISKPADTTHQVESYKHDLMDLIKTAHEGGADTLVLNRYIPSTHNNQRSLFFTAVEQLCKETDGLRESSSYVNKTMQHISCGDSYIYNLVWR